MEQKDLDLLKKLRSSIVSVGPYAMDMLEAFDKAMDIVNKHKMTEQTLDAARTELMLSDDYELLTKQGLEREASLQRRLKHLGALADDTKAPFCHWCCNHHMGERRGEGKYCPGPLLSPPDAWTEEMLHG